MPAPARSPGHLRDLMLSSPNQGIDPTPADDNAQWANAIPARLLTRLSGYRWFNESWQREADWRRGRDSNPRYGCPYAAFRVRCFQPLSHLSVAPRQA